MPKYHLRGGSGLCAYQLYLFTLNQIECFFKRVTIRDCCLCVCRDALSEEPLVHLFNVTGSILGVCEGPFWSLHYEQHPQRGGNHNAVSSEMLEVGNVMHRSSTLVYCKRIRLHQRPR